MGFTTLGTVIRFAPLVIIIGAMFMKNTTPKAAAFVYWSVVSAIGRPRRLASGLYRPVGGDDLPDHRLDLSGLCPGGLHHKLDLSPIGSFLIMGAWGLVIAMIVNMFMHLPALSFIINAAGVLIFAGLTAWDTQRLKMTYYQIGGDQAAMSVATSYGALSLYLDFINLFQFLMSLLGSRR